MASPRSGVHQHTVLVVDDATDTREALAAVLELQGYRVVTAGSGREALYLMVTLELRPCTALVDIMPDMDGLTLRMAMLAHPELARIPAVALSAHERLRRQALDTDFVAALLKPCSVEQLLSLIGQHCPAATSRAKPA